MSKRDPLVVLEDIRLAIQKITVTPQWIKTRLSQMSSSFGNVSSDTAQGK